MSGARAILITGGTGSLGRRCCVISLPLTVARSGSLAATRRNRTRCATSSRISGSATISATSATGPAVDHAMRGVEHVFHAAALKQVPSCEFFPVEAIRTNTLGSANVIESAVANGVRSAHLLSTDKAAFPINAMGMTKALMEKIVQSIARRLEAERGQTIVSSRPLRQRDVLARLGDPPLHPPDQGRSADHDHRADHDPVHDAAHGLR